MESAAALAKEIGNWREVGDFYRRASELYIECGRSQPASDALAKGARFTIVVLSLIFQQTLLMYLMTHLLYRHLPMPRISFATYFTKSALEDVVLDEAIHLYIGACSTLEEDGKEQMAFDLYRGATIVYIKMEKYTDAAAFLLRWGLAADKCNATNSQCKAYLSAIIVYLYADDLKQAEKCYGDCSQIDAFLRSDQNRFASKLLAANKEGDIEEIKRLAQSSTISNLDHVIIRLARKLPTGDVSALKSDTAKEQEEPLDENDLT